MSQRNQVLVFAGRLPGVRNKSEDFGWDLVDWCKAVLPIPNQAEDLEGVLFESVDLRTKNENA